MEDQTDGDSQAETEEDQCVPMSYGQMDMQTLVNIWVWHCMHPQPTKDNDE